MLRFFEKLGHIGLNVIKGFIYLFGLIFRLIYNLLSLIVKGIGKGIIFISAISFIAIIVYIIFKYVLGG